MLSSPVKVGQGGCPRVGVTLQVLPSLPSACHDVTSRKAQRDMTERGFGLSQGELGDPGSQAELRVGLL